jgi:hypothetical protein
MSTVRSDSVLKGRRSRNRIRGTVLIEPKGWGREVWLVNNDQHCGKVQTVRLRLVQSS